MGQMGQHWCVLFLILLWFQCAISGGDKEALLGLKSSIDPSNSLHWNGNNFCKWDGVRECLRGRVSKLVLENLNLKGTLDSRFLNQLDQIRVLSFKQNSIFGKIPDLSGLKNLKSVYFSYNNFSGEFPASLTTLHRLKTIVLSGNHLSGEIPDSLLNVKRLYAFYVDDNNFTVICLKKRKKESPPEKKSDTAAVTAASGSGGGGGVASGSGKNGGSGFAAEGDEGVGKLVFFFAGDSPEMSYSLEDLLKASAETLGRGTVGSTYKAVMESGFIVTVKRLKDARYPRVEEFRRHVDVIGRLRHQNLVPLRAYFQAKEERLLVYDYFPNGSLFSLIHGSRTSAGGKPLHWTSCLKIAEDLATGLLYIHQNPGLTHGNLKSSNVLLGSDFESCLTDYGLMSFRNPDFPEESSASSLFYRAPECRDPRKPITQQADVYSFGVLLLELLTGKTPYQDLVLEHGSDIPKWVKSVRDEETESGDEPTSSGNETSEEKLTALLNIAMACISLVPENRPVMKEVLRMIRETRAEAAHVSSNSSDHSPGRWSDTVQSLPRDEHLSI
ncbi:inactive leucine-rich repeat receptor-like serine/threonine-protein kinase At1g60630 isoform X2 [Helianthus annuus]|uniref:inactive leucine-rich repeat receptor-like serine/threonine-protein kinase At1g60630 isoform X2 n=1 Tax=Helianthus annuus TaxID=4232 RepID=UPI001652EF8F|nr:inactive leucine-rich repeat receptor-like serine/threonine-protein kinase At1g60630 isoform X2 [Helianthus annuus]